MVSTLSAIIWGLVEPPSLTTSQEEVFNILFVLSHVQLHEEDIHCLTAGMYIGNHTLCSYISGWLLYYVFTKKESMYQER